MWVASNKSLTLSVSSVRACAPFCSGTHTLTFLDDGHLNRFQVTSNYATACTHIRSSWRFTLQHAATRYNTLQRNTALCAHTWMVFTINPRLDVLNEVKFESGRVMSHIWIGKDICLHKWLRCPTMQCTRHAYTCCDMTHAHVWHGPFMCVTDKQHMAHVDSWRYGHKQQNPMFDMGWLRLVGSLKLQVSLQNIGLFCRTLLKRDLQF